MEDSPAFAPPELLTIGEAAEFLGVSPWTLRNWDSSGKLKAERDPLNGYRIYRRDDLESALKAGELLRRRKRAPAPRFDWDQIGESEHFVQFYESDRFLVASVSEFLSRGLGAGDAAIVIATREHRRDIARLLNERGIDLLAARDSGQYVSIDAAETLALVMDGNSPDPSRFAEVVGGTIAASAQHWPRVRAFGEMVALLCEQDEGREAACRLEEFWNDLAKQHSFALYCGYPLQSFDDGRDENSFKQICTCHTRVIPAEGYLALSTTDEQLREITLLQQKARALEAEMAQRRQAEEELTDFVENAVEGLHKVGPDGRILWANQAELDLLGYTRDEYIGHHIEEFHVDQDVIEDILTRLTSGQSIQNYPARLRAKDGSIKNVLIHSNGCYRDGKLLYTRCFTRDMTEYLAAERDRALLAAIITSSDDAIISKDLDGVITSWNRGAERLFGYSAEEVIGQPVTLLIPEDRLQEEPGILARIRCGERIEHFETIRRRKDGTFLDISLTISPIMSPDGRVVGASKISRDITEWKKTVEQLTQSEERYRQLTELLPVGVYACEGPSGEISYFNAQAVRLWGRSPQQDETTERFCGSLRLYLPDGTFLPHAECPMALALREGRQFRNEEVVVERPDGTRFTALVNIDPVRDGDGKIVGAINVFHDVSALKRAEDALLEQKENLETLLETLPVGVMISFDRECKRIAGNRAANELLRMPCGANISKSAPPAELPAHFRVVKAGKVVAPQDLPLQRAVRGESIDDEELIHEFDDGSVVHTIVSAQPLFGADGRPRGAVGAILDVTELKNAEHELRERDRRKDEFLAILAHELRNPLAPIRTGLELMKMGSNDPALHEEIRETMERQTEQLVSLVDDLLDVSRITRGKLDLRRCTVTLADVVQSAVEASRPAIDDAGHSLTIEMPEQPIELFADPNRLSQVVSNLLNNAAKYTPQGGAIRIAVERQQAEAVITVTDNGKGIPAEMREAIFEMFAQIERPGESAYTGLGIGLTLVKTLVQMHGGRIRVQSPGEGRGSTFLVRLPIGVPTETIVDAVPGNRGHAIAEELRVLVVDDNEAAAKMLAMIVQEMGNVVRTAKDGREALDIAGEFRPDVVLMDLGMPNLNGYEAAQYIRQQPWGQKMLLVALTGWGQEEDRQRTAEAGFDHHFVKPAESADLQELFAKLAANS